MDIDALRTFLAVARSGSFGGAASALRTPKSTVSRRIADLESRLGLRLIERTTRSQRLTAEGQLLLARAERLIGEADDIVRILGAARGDTGGHLRIACPTLFGQIFIGAIAARCRSLHPDLTLELVFLDRPPDLIEEGFDGAIRVGPLPESGQIARVFATDEIILAGSPVLLDTRAAPQVPEDLVAWPLVGFGQGRRRTWTFRRGDDVREIAVETVISITSMVAVRESVLAGAGLAVMAGFLIAGDLAGGRLRRLLPDWRGPLMPLSFVYPSPHAMTARLRAFVDVLVESFPQRRLDRPPA
jgi:DNA-binding transcriptional LysR family regulator